MAPKKEKQQAPTVDEAEANILSYMISQNRPYSATDVFQNLHGAMSRPVVNRALAALETRGQLDSKTFGKQVIYVAKQTKVGRETGEGGDGSDERSEADIAAEIEQLKTEDASLTKQAAKLKADLSEVQMMPRTDELASRKAELDIEIEKASKRLDFLQAAASGNAGVPLLSAADVAKLRAELAKMLKEWPRRRKMFMDMWAVIRENVPDAKDLWDDLGIEDDVVSSEVVRETAKSPHVLHITNINHPPPRSSASAGDALTLSIPLAPPTSAAAVTTQSSVAPQYPPLAPVVQPQRTKQRQPQSPMLGSQASSQPAFLESSRSPPGKSAFPRVRMATGRSRHLSHVPCKFFRQGTCQAGNTCPFSHSMDSQLEQAPCKYFQKGNCKFGAKCALAHILPDGRRVNHRSLSHNYGPLQLGARNILPDLNANSYSNNPSALARSLIAQHNGQPAQQNAPPPPPPPAQASIQPLDIPEFGLEYGASPPTENFMSPSSVRTLGPLDVPMPASLDSNGISFLARHGPIAASVPAKFGSLDASPPTLLPHQNAGGGVDLNALSSSHTLRSLYMSAFGVDSEHGLSSSVKKGGVVNGRAGFASPGTDEPPASPPAGTNPATTTNTPGVPQRLSNMSHSPFGPGLTANPSSGLAGRRYVSSSFPARSSIWRGSTNLTHDEDEFYPSANGSYHTSNADSFLLDDSASNNAFAYEEDFVPSSLNELLTPQERHRRGSRHDDNFHTGEYSSSISGRLGNTGTIGDGIVSSSPRGIGFGESPRFGQLFNGHHGGLVANNPSSNNVSAIGSPLRYSSHGTVPTTVTTAGADTNGSSSYFLSTSPLATTKKFSGGAVQRTPSGRRVVSPTTVVIEEDDEEDGSHLNTHIIPKSEEDEDETQFIMDEEQLDHGASSNGRRSLIDGAAAADTGDSVNGVDAVEGKLNGLVLSR
ncbi:Tat binding protein 1-interacting protein-domain-containing protein [Lipomyces kononenkoae]|uniref:Tat binding protein 1-interacting protein-domain-containing protein n=1 Tax=Lipomyces kononenkoae TaxID=34357 RepID=A0ACC3T2Z3_LIPKO